MQLAATLAQAVERHHPNLVMLCSFQKEESVLIDELIRIGGRLGPEPRFGEVVVRKVPHWDLNETLLKIFSLYETTHEDGETFREFAERTPAEWWSERLEPEPVEA